MTDIIILTLHNTKDKKVYVNKNQIVSFYIDAKTEGLTAVKSFTIVDTVNKDSIGVKETPEQILDLLSK